jgi:glycosyltransferase domain-containing protein
MNLTIVIPTKNRLDFFYKIVDYYSHKDFTCKILFIDSSNKIIFNTKKKYIDSKKQTKIKILHVIGYAHEVIKLSLHHIRTKYVAQSGDDDFYILSGLKAAISFLENNNSYIGAFGKIYLTTKFQSNNIAKLYNKNSKSLNNNESYSRLMSLISNYFTLFFSVIDTKQYKKSYNDLEKKKYPSMQFYDELQLSFILSILGKFKKINHDFLLRFVGHTRNQLPKFDFNKEVISLKSIFNFLNTHSKNKYHLDAHKIWWKKKILKSFYYKSYIFLLTFINTISNIFYLKKFIRFFFPKRNLKNIKSINLILKDSSLNKVISNS